MTAVASAVGPCKRDAVGEAKLLWAPQAQDIAVKMPVKSCGNKEEFVTAREDTLEDCTCVPKHRQWHVRNRGKDDREV